MKKIIFGVAAFYLCATVAQAQVDAEVTATVTTGKQYSVGDIYEKDGVKTVVLSVDASGQHGIAMLLPEAIQKVTFYSTSLYWRENPKGMLSQLQSEKKEVKSKENMAKIKGNQTFFADWVRNNNMVSNDKKLMKSRLEHQNKIQPQMGEDGKQNMAVVERYCVENGVDMKEAFPEFAYAKSLGEGWFIPGNQEAKYYADFIGFGFGRDKNIALENPHKLVVKKMMEFYREYLGIYVKHREVEEDLNDRLGVVEGKRVYLPFGIFSSSMKKFTSDKKYYEYDFSLVGLVCEFFNLPNAATGCIMQATSYKAQGLKGVYSPGGVYIDSKKVKNLVSPQLYPVEGVSFPMHFFKAETSEKGRCLYYFDDVPLSFSASLGEGSRYMMVRPFCEF